MGRIPQDRTVIRERVRRGNWVLGRLEAGLFNDEPSAWDEVKELVSAARTLREIRLIGYVQARSYAAALAEATR